MPYVFRAYFLVFSVFRCSRTMSVIAKRRKKGRTICAKLNLLSTSLVLELLLVLKTQMVAAATQPPHIVFVLIDDLGFNDVGFHGSLQTKTPNIDRLANEGIILDNYYGLPVCTPSRAALMTGRYPAYNGMQHYVLQANEPWALGLDDKILPEYLKLYNYSTHMLGKWNLGSYLRKYLPTSRGFDTYFGYYGEHQDYYRRFLVAGAPLRDAGYDFYNNTNFMNDTSGTYITDLITNESVRIIQAHDENKPMFLYVAHNGIHSGNEDDPLQATAGRLARFPNVTHAGRQKVLGMVAAVDDSVGAIFDALQTRNFNENLIFIFSSDNGGPANGFNLNYANNWPLKGGKQTLWEGGIRLAAFMWSPHFDTTRYRSNHLMHITDFLPTLVGQAAKAASSAALPQPVFPGLDGVNMWDALSHNTKTSPRHEILVQYNQVYNWGALRYHRWKMVVGEGGQTKTNGPGHYAPESDPKPQTTVQCNRTSKPLTSDNACNALVAPCLYDINHDPCEYRNLAREQPDILRQMLKRYNFLIRDAVVPRNRPADACSNPLKYSNTWTTWLEYSGGEAAEALLNVFSSNANRRAYFFPNYTTPACTRTIIAL